MSAICVFFLVCIYYTVFCRTPPQLKPKVQFSVETKKKPAIFVSDSAQLNLELSRIPTHLKSGEENSEIILLPGEYNDVNINKSRLKLKGFGPYTTFQGRKTFIEISGSVVTLQNISIQSKMFILRVTGNSNLVKGVRGTWEDGMLGLSVNGTGNTLENFAFQFYLPNNFLDLNHGEFSAQCQTQFDQEKFFTTSILTRFALLTGHRKKISSFNSSFVFKSTLDMKSFFLCKVQKM